MLGYPAVELLQETAGREPAFNVGQLTFEALQRLFASTDSKGPEGDLA